jgi:hypothetical protein
MTSFWRRFYDCTWNIFKISVPINSVAKLVSAPKKQVMPLYMNYNGKQNAILTSVTTTNCYSRQNYLNHFVYPAINTKHPKPYSLPIP